MRSHAYGLLTNRADDDDVRRAITPALIEDLGDALDSALNDCRPALDAEIMAAVAAVVGLVGQNWPGGSAAREEFCLLATGEFLSLPGALVLDALARARRRVTDGRLLVAWVCDDVEPKAEKLKVECDRLTRLVELALPAA